MAAPRLGNRFLIVGGGDPSLVAAVGVKTGLTGRTAVYDESPDRAEEARRFATADGALVESASGAWTALPHDSDAFDVVVLRDVLARLAPALRAQVVEEALRVLRPGGRVLVIDVEERGALSALFGRGAPADTAYAAAGGGQGALQRHRFVAVRTLAARDGLTFVEGVKRNA